MPVVTAAMYRAARPGLVTAQDTEILAAINSAEQLIESTVGRSLLSAQRTETQCSSGMSNLLQLDQWPLTDVSAVSKWTGTVWEEVSQFSVVDANTSVIAVGSGGGLYASTSYVSYNYDEMGPSAFLGNSIDLTYRITYTAGYAADSLPVKLREAFYNVVDAVRAERGSFSLALSDDFSGLSKVNRNAEDYRERLRLLMLPFKRSTL